MIVLKKSLKLTKVYWDSIETYIESIVNNEVVDKIEPQEVIGETAANDNVTDVITLVFKVTKALIVVIKTLTIDDPVVEVIANKRALKLDKLQQTQRTLPIIAKQSSTRNLKSILKHLKYNFFNFF